MSNSPSIATVSFPALNEMGVNNPHQIVGYSLRSDGADKDVLKLKYKREKGSFLPQTRTYKFGRSLRMVIADGGTSRMEHTYEISPFLLKAVAELDRLVDGVQSNTSPATAKTESNRNAELVKELESLEAMVSGHVSMTDAATVAARFARLKAQIASI